MIIIRIGTVDDAALIADISRQTFYETFAPLNEKEHMDKFMNEQFTKEALMKEVRGADNIFLLAYEGNELVIKGDKFFINGQEASSYTFKQNYIWCMGDNRHNSEDSRIWGYVPADHVVGKPLFIWFSTKNGNMREGINWNRIFRSASSM